MSRAQRIADQLGMSQGAANHKLRKQLLWKYVRLAEHNFCHKCGVIIETIDDFSIEHKEPWEGRDPELFWNLDNIAFSHVQCNRPHTFGNGPPVTKIREYGHAWCNICKQTKDVLDFARNARRRTGLQDYCKDCHNKMKRTIRGGKADT